MKNLIITLTLTTLSLSSFAGRHLPLDLTFEESLKLHEQIKQYERLKNNEDEEKNDVADYYRKYDKDLKEAIKAGEKLSAWLKKINEARSGEDQVRLTSKETQSRSGIPVDRPFRYSPKIVKERTDKIKEGLNPKVAAVFYGKEPISKEMYVSKEEFIKFGRKISGTYQIAVRWKGSLRWMDWYKRASLRDVRGLYYLKKVENLDDKLTQYSRQSEEVQGKLKELLVKTCMTGNGKRKTCETTFQEYLKENKLVLFKAKVIATAMRTWNAFFDISRPRNDVEWIPAGQNEMRVVFKNIKDPEIAAWLKENVEEEFKFEPEDFTMTLKYIRGNWGTAYLEFKPGVTPHVAGGNKLVMDANQDIKEYSVQWTIRHEFGHILRLPDCYHEFFDTEKMEMVNYQLDTSDLMCSRAGKMNERIYKELERVYKK